MGKGRAERHVVVFVIEATLIAFLAAVGGWVCGGMSAYAAGRLLSQDGLAAAPKVTLVVDPLMQGGLAAIWVALLAMHGPTVTWLLSALLAIPLLQVAVTDARTRYVYMPVAIPGVVIGAAASPFIHAGGPLVGVLGAVGCGLVFLAIYLLGRRLYPGQEPLARGDVTIAAMVGAVAGPHAPAALMYGIVASGLLALAMLIARRSMRIFMPYGPGLCLGGLIALFLR